MNEEQFIEAINRSMQESAARLRAMGREPYSVTREEAERLVSMLLKAKEEFFANRHCLYCYVYKERVTRALVAKNNTVLSPRR